MAWKVLYEINGKQHEDQCPTEEAAKGWAKKVFQRRRAETTIVGPGDFEGLPEEEGNPPDDTPDLFDTSTSGDGE